MGLEQTKRFETFPAKLSKQCNENQRKEKSIDSLGKKKDTSSNLAIYQNKIERSNVQKAKERKKIREGTKLFNCLKRQKMDKHENKGKKLLRNFDKEIYFSRKRKKRFKRF